MANGNKKEEKQSEAETRIAAKVGNKGKEEKKAVFVCSLDNERFERFGHLARWYREVHGISTLIFAEQLYIENQALKSRITELEKQ